MGALHLLMCLRVSVIQPLLPFIMNKIKSVNRIQEMRLKKCVVMAVVKQLKKLQRT